MSIICEESYEKHLKKCT